MFKLLYTADLHGNEDFYKILLKKSEGEYVDAIVIGGDLCGREGNTIKDINWLIMSNFNTIYGDGS